MTRKFFLSLILLLTIVGCSHIPLSTMLSMSSFDAEDFIAINPQELRVRVITNTPAKFIEKRTTLLLTFTSPDAKFDKVLHLEKISDNLSTESHWVGKDTVKHTTDFKLDEAGVETFKDIQSSPYIVKRPDNSSFKFKIKWRLDSEDPLKYTIRTDLLFQPEDGYFTLLEGLEIDQTKPNHTACNRQYCNSCA